VHEREAPELSLKTETRIGCRTLWTHMGYMHYMDWLHLAVQHCLLI